MTTIPQLCEAVQDLLIRAASEADAALHYTRRPDSAKLTGPVLTQTLVLGWLAHPDATGEQLVQSAARAGVVVTSQAIDQRFTLQTAALLQAVLRASMQHRIASDPVALPILQRFAGVRVIDSTTIVLPDALAAYGRGCGGSTVEGTSAALKCGLQLDLLTGAWCGLDVTDGRASDQRLSVQHASLPAGSLRLADLGFYELELLARHDQQGVYWLSKLPPSTLVSTDTVNEQQLLPFLQSLGACEQWDGLVWVGKGRRLRARLLLQRVPQEVADQRRRRLRKEARRHGRVATEATLALAAWTLLITNTPSELLSLKEALVVARVRWQIELVFKLWKSQGQVDAWRSSKPARILCEVYGKLLALVLQHWLLVRCCWGYPDRSLVKAAQVVREHALLLAYACGDLRAMQEVVATIERVLQRAARMNPRRKRPNTYQLLLALTTEEPTPAAS
jgi:hypothetical protein